MTWDENDVDRVELNEKVNTGKLSEVPDSELRKFVAYSSEEEDEDEDDSNDFESKNPDVNEEISAPEEAPNTSMGKKSRKKEDIISKYKNLLNDINKKEAAKKKNKVEMEFSWGINKNASSSVDSNGKGETKSDDLTPFEKLIEKKREKKRAHKEKIRQLKKQQNPTEGSESDDDLPDGIDLNDPYFAEEFANGEFAPVKTNKKKSKKVNKDDEANDSDKPNELELLLDDDDGKAHFSLKKIQERENESKTSKKRRKKLKKSKQNKESKPIEDDFQIDVADNRFAAIYSSHLFNIDPTDSHYRKTKGMETLIHEKLKRKNTDVIQSDDGSTEDGGVSGKKRKNVANSILIKSIKRKVQQQN